MGGVTDGNETAGGLPGVLREVAEAAGEPAALRLAHVYGGTKVYIPHRLPPGHALTEAAGRAAAEWLVKTYAGEILLVPLGPEADGRAKRAAIRERLRDGQPAQRIARELNCHVRTVERESARLRGAGDDRQLSLLD